MQYIQPITNIYHVTEPLMDTANVSSNAVQGVKQQPMQLGNHYAR